jgi:hypothetical protein
MSAANAIAYPCVTTELSTQQSSEFYDPAAQMVLQAIQGREVAGSARQKCGSLSSRF